jgi:hypothetical protein
MRSKFLVCAAIAAVGASASFVSPVHAADAKSKVDKSAKAKLTELHADDKSIKRQTQWEDKVMGPDNKRSELDKIARARAINEKAEKDKADRERQAAFDPPPAPRAAPPKKNEKAELSLLTSPDKGDAKAHDISPQLATEAARKAPTPVKPADDRFIDKLLREEDAPSKKRASTTDKELENLLAGAKENKPVGRKRGDSVDDLLKTADKGPAMPAPRAQSGGLPEWAKQPDIAPTPAPPPPPVAARPAPKRNDNDGVIHVVQGAAGNAPAIVSSSSRATTVATRPGRKTATATTKAPVAWSDPFADKRPVADATPKKAAASHPSASTDSSWNDPFAEPSGDTRKSVRHAAPSTSPASPASAPKRNNSNDKSEPSARPASWKDPFTKAPTEPSRAPVAMRELTKSESSKWEIASRRPAAHAATADTHAAGGWSVLKKRAR